MKIIIQTEQHVTIRFTWREMALLQTIINGWRWAVTEQRLGSNKWEWPFVAALRGVIHRSIDKRELDVHMGEQ